MRIGLVAVVGVLSMHAMPCVAQAQVPSSGVYIAPTVNAVRTDNDRGVDDHAAFSLAVGAEVHPQWNVELNLFRGRFDAADRDDLTMDAAGVDVLRVFRRNARIAPYLLLGLGAQRKDRRMSETSTDPYVDAGAGLLATFLRSEDDGRAVSLRLDARARHDDMDEGSRLDYLLGVGLQYAFGSGPRRASAPVLPPVSTPAPAPVPPPDADRDGVADGVDRCPDTAAGVRVDAHGCELKQEIRLPSVTFEYDSDRLQPEALATLDQAVQTLILNPDLQVEVAGHTDSRGSDAYNLSLSQRRAEAVRRYIVERGAANVLTTRGYGESDPIADNGLDAGRAENRRVVLRIVSP